MRQGTFGWRWRASPLFGILYGALCAMAQTDWKKLVAYSSVSHMGYVMLGLAVMTPAQPLTGRITR